MNRATRFWIFLASLGFGGNRPSLRNDKMGFVHLGRVCIGKVWNSLILGEFCSSSLQSFILSWLSTEALHATSSASAFWSRGIWTNFARWKVFTSWFVNLRYFCILVSFASKSPLTCPMTSCKSLLSTIFSTLSAWVIRSPVNKASYSASLLVIGNLSWTPYLRTSFSGEVITMLLRLLSKWTIHQCLSSKGLLGRLCSWGW